MFKLISTLIFSSLLSTLLLINGCASNPTTQPTAVVPATRTFHTVQEGETLETIASLYNVDYQTLADLNQLSPPYSILPGQTLLISDNEVITDPSDQTYNLSAKGFNSSDNERLTASTGKNYHVVKRKETLKSIAKRYGINHLTLAKWNRLSPPYSLKVGQRLRVSANSKSIASPPANKITSTPKTTIKPPSNKPSNKTSHIVQRNETLSDIALRYGYTTEEVAYWNGLKPPYDLPVGFRLRVAPLPTKSGRITKASGGRTHTVTQGDTLYSLSKAYGVSLTDLANWNNLQPPYTLAPGQVVRVARTTSTSTSRPTNNVAYGRVRTTGAAAAHNSGYHTVAASETLYSIAKRYGYTANQVASWNQLRPPYALEVGQTLRVYPPSGVLNKVRYKTGMASGRQNHRVAAGETLYSIARRYGYSVNQVAAWNGLSPPYTLSAGQVLRVAP
jgi:LysM repeat protein